MISDGLLILFAGIAGLVCFYLASVAKPQITRTKVHGIISDQVSLEVNIESTKQRIRIALKRILDFCKYVLGKTIIPTILIVIIIAVYKLITAIKSGSEGDTVKALVWLIIPLIAIILLFMVEKVLDYKMRRKLERTGSPYFPKIYKGNGVLPKRVYEGDSLNVHFSFSSISDYGLDRICRHSKNEIKSVILEVENPKNKDLFLEMQILAAGISISGEERQQVKLGQKLLNFDWNCHFENSGNHSLAFILRIMEGSKEHFLGRIEHKVKVVRLDHLTKRQVHLLASFAATISAAFAIIEAFKRIFPNP